MSFAKVMSTLFRATLKRAIAGKFLQMKFPQILRGTCHIMPWLTHVIRERSELYLTAPKIGKVYLSMACCYTVSTLTNSLVGVLTRFRMHPVAVVADVQEIFQVRALQRDCDAVRFVRWPNGDLTKDLVDYQMVVHLFGLTNFLS